MKKLVDYAIEKGVRDKLVIVSGGTQVTPEIARKNKMDQGFGRGTKGIHIASYVLDKHREMNE